MAYHVGVNGGGSGCIETASQPAKEPVGSKSCVAQATTASVRRARKVGQRFANHRPLQLIYI